MKNPYLRIISKNPVVEISCCKWMFIWRFDFKYSTTKRTNFIIEEAVIIDCIDKIKLDLFSINTSIQIHYEILNAAHIHCGNRMQDTNNFGHNNYLQSNFARIMQKTDDRRASK